MTPVLQQLTKNLFQKLEYWALVSLLTFQLVCRRGPHLKCPTSPLMHNCSRLTHKIFIKHNTICFKRVKGSKIFWFITQLRTDEIKHEKNICNIFIFLLVTHRSLTPRFFSTRLDGYSSQHGESFQSRNKQNINNVFRPIFNITSLETHSESNKTKKVAST